MEVRIPKWEPRTPELKIEYAQQDRDKYESNDPSGLYYSERWLTTPITIRRERELSSASADGYWKTVGGRGRYGEFPVVVARKYFRERKYSVWGSEPRLVNGEGYALLSFSGYRERGHESYRRMVNIFGEEALRQLSAEADEEKRRYRASHNLGGGRSGGDPDLFVFKGDGKVKRFFVEVKENDQLSPLQKLCFSLIERHLQCEVRVCHVCSREPNTLRVKAHASASTQGR